LPKKNSKNRAGPEFKPKRYTIFSEIRAAEKGKAVTNMLEEGGEDRSSKLTADGAYERRMRKGKIHP